MNLKLFAAAGTGIAALAMVTATPAAAYDPCERAIQREQETGQAFLRWCYNHGGPGRCENKLETNARGRDLALTAYYAQQARRRACA